MIAIYHRVRIPGLANSGCKKGRHTYLVIGLRDTVSFLFRRGKKKAYKVVMSAAQDITALTTYGDTDVSLSNEVNKSARLFYLAIRQL